MQVHGRPGDPAVAALHAAAHAHAAAARRGARARAPRAALAGPAAPPALDVSLTSLIITTGGCWLM